MKMVSSTGTGSDATDDASAQLSHFLVPFAPGLLRISFAPRWAKVTCNDRPRLKASEARRGQGPVTLAPISSTTLCHWIVIGGKADAAGTRGEQSRELPRWPPCQT